MKTATRIWGVWDCTELLSVHVTHDDALDAREHHLNRCRCYTDDQDVIPAAVEIRAIDLPAYGVPVESRNRPLPAPQDGADHGHDARRRARTGREYP
ncbi:MAG: hypothetical protein ACSLE6_00090 [Mycobacterium sp.]